MQTLTSRSKLFFDRQINKRKYIGYKNTWITYMNLAIKRNLISDFICKPFRNFD